MGYFLDEFKKEKTPTFDGEIKKSWDVEAWFLGMNKLFNLHDYLANMKSRIVIFSLKGKVDIWDWWEDVKNVGGIYEEEMTWNEFDIIFMKKYLSERYYDDTKN